MNFKKYIKENNKLSALKSFSRHSELDEKILDFMREHIPEQLNLRTVIQGSSHWQVLWQFVHNTIHDPENELYGVHWYGERERAKEILNSFLERNGFFEGI
jgi:hypothetical protein